MLNRKESKLANGAERYGRSKERSGPAKERQHRRRFIISPKAQQRAPEPRLEATNGQAHQDAASQAKAAYASRHPAGAGRTAGQAVDLTETIKTLLHLGH